MNKKRGQIMISAVFGIVTFTASVLGVYYTNQATISNEIHKVDIQLSAKDSTDSRQDEAINTIKSELKEIKDLQIQTLREIRYK